MSLTIWETIQSELKQGPELRKKQIKAISEAFENRYVISMYTRFRTDASITDEDYEMLHTLIAGSEDIQERKILFVIHSPGGDPLAAEKIINLLSEFSDNDYWVLIPGTAKSAATMICFGASRIVLSSLSELGPIDLQIFEEDSVRPTSSIITAYDKLIEMGINLGEDQNVEPVLQQLQYFDPSEIEYYRQINNLAGDIAKKVLKKCMMKESELEDIEKTIEIFTNPEKSIIHERPIYYSDIKEMDKQKFFDIQCVNVNDDIWKIVTEYHLRAIHSLRASGNSKMIESLETCLIATRR